MSSGSGFLVAPDLVMTNAHVLGDLPELVVEDREAEHPASVALMDETTDVAILRAGNLTGRPLRLSNGSVDRRVKGVVLGFPHGGPLRSVAAAVRDPEPVFVVHAPLHPMFYRSVVQLQAHVERGHSGGPFVGLNGDVLGVVFSQATALIDVTYALRSDHLIWFVRQAQERPAVTPVPRSTTC